MDLAARLRHGDVRALARGIRMVEDAAPGAEALLREVRGGPRAHVVGVTGPPGSGKSTLCDGLIRVWRERGLTVGVLAVDPSSPFSGGAVLGDRVRMQRHAGDPGVYIRSMAARGHLGGLAGAARQAVRLIEASGRDRCLLETVGVGQSELEVMRSVDTTVVVVTPAAGDGVQVIKAGILEIADVFVVNKADLPGSAKMARDLVELAHHAAARSGWEAPVLSTIATEARGVDELRDAVERHREAITVSGELERRRAERLRAEIEAIVVERSVQRARAALRGGTMGADLDRDPEAVDPYAVADRILDGRSGG